MEQHEEGGSKEMGVGRPGRPQTRAREPRKFGHIRDHSTRRGKSNFVKVLEIYSLKIICK